MQAVRSPQQVVTSVYREDRSALIFWGCFWLPNRAVRSISRLRACHPPGQTRLSRSDGSEPMLSGRPPALIHRCRGAPYRQCAAAPCATTALSGR